MDLLRKIFIAALIGLVFSIIGVYAYTNTVTWTQNPKTPDDGTMQIYRADGITLIGDASDQTAIWTWYPATTSFDATIKIDNTSPNNLNINVDIQISGLASGWIAHGFGTQSNITPVEIRTVTLSIVNPNAQPNTNVGSFSITASIT